MCVCARVGPAPCFGGETQSVERRRSRAVREVYMRATARWAMPCHSLSQDDSNLWQPEVRAALQPNKVVTSIEQACFKSSWSLGPRAAPAGRGGRPSMPALRARRRLSGQALS